jgi:hypothetical protein
MKPSRTTGARRGGAEDGARGRRRKLPTAASTPINRGIDGSRGERSIDQRDLPPEGLVVEARPAARHVTSWPAEQAGDDRRGGRRVADAHLTRNDEAAAIRGESGCHVEPDVDGSQGLSTGHRRPRREVGRADLIPSREGRRWACGVAFRGDDDDAPDGGGEDTDRARRREVATIWPVTVDGTPTRRGRHAVVAGHDDDRPRLTTGPPAVMPA